MKHGQSTYFTAARVRGVVAGRSSGLIALFSDISPVGSVENPMITLYSYPELFGVADNNGYGLKVFAFLRLNRMPFKHEHIFDASAAPRGQLPYIVDDGEAVGDSDTIIAHLV